MKLSLEELNNYPEKYKNYYEQVLPICLKCDLFSEIDETCIMEEKNIFDIVKSESPICPIGNW